MRGLCMARADGTRRLRLTRGMDSSPSWAPSGRAVVFTRGGKVTVANARGRTTRTLAAGSEPAWSPDGQRIAFAAGNQILIVTAAGRPVGQVAIQSLAGGPSWSTDSRRLAFSESQEVEQGGTLRRVFTVNADGSSRRLLVSQASDASWSPDGSRIAYVSYASRFAETGHIAVANADGTSPRRLTRATAPESQPAWAPGGRRLALTRAGAIVVAKADGSDERVAVRGGTDPAWRPPALLPRAARKAC